MPSIGIRYTIIETYHCVHVAAEICHYWYSRHCI